jgi:hypothetical protein
MKTKVLALAIIMAATSLTTSASAQDRILALFKKCETLDNVDMNVIRERKDGKLADEIVNIRIAGNEALVNEFLAAFKAEEPNMISVIEKKVSGKLVPNMMEFESCTISFNLRDKANANISKILESRRAKIPKGASGISAPKPASGPSAGEYVMIYD